MWSYQVHLGIINGNRTRSHTLLIEQAASRHVASGTTIEVVQSEDAPPTVESFVSIHLSAVAMLQIVARLQQRADAIVIACFSDPGLYAAREVAAVPVIGTAEAAMHMASLVARTFSILAGRDDRAALVHEMVRMHGFTDRCVGIRSIGLSVLDTHASPEDTQSRLLEAGRAATREDRAEAICLGCAAYTGMEQALSDALGVPVLDGVVCAVKLAEAVVGAGLRTSRAGAFMRATLAGELVGS